MMKMVGHQEEQPTCFYRVNLIEQIKHDDDNDDNDDDDDDDDDVAVSLQCSVVAEADCSS